jgi:voltage-gated potassium channel
MDAKTRLRLVLALILLVLAVGTFGYKLVGLKEGQNWPFVDCVYMTVITLTTVGYREAVPIEHSTVGKLFTIMILLVGFGAIGYGLSNVTAFLVEGELHNIVWRKKMQKRADARHDHFIICGAGSTGIHVVEELVRTARPLVVIERNEDVAKQVEGLGAPCVICGDATEDHVLLQAGVERAAGLVAALPEDKDNLLLTLSARQINSRLRIISRATNLEMRAKLIRAGADSVVSPNQIGGLRMVSELVRPHVVSFLDEMLRDRRSAFRMEQVIVSEKADFAGKTLAESNITGRTGLLVVALRPPGDAPFIYNPRGAEQVAPGSTIVVIGDVEAVGRLRAIAEIR